MKDKDPFNLKNITSLLKFFELNRTVDFLRANLLSDAEISTLDFTLLTEKREELLFLAKAYQRLIRIAPERERDVALALLAGGIHSALQIAQMTRKDFMGRFAGVLKDEKLADSIYQNALKKRGVILLQYMDVYQNNEPHIKAARFS